MSWLLTLIANKRGRIVTMNRFKSKKKIYCPTTISLASRIWDTQSLIAFKSWYYPLCVFHILNLEGSFLCLFMFDRLPYKLLEFLWVNSARKSCKFTFLSISCITIEVIIWWVNFLAASFPIVSMIPVRVEEDMHTVLKPKLKYHLLESNHDCVKH